MIEFLRKFENRGIKISQVNSILLSKYINLQLFPLILHGVGVRCDRRRFSVLSQLIEKSMTHVIMKTIQKRSIPNDVFHFLKICGITSSNRDNWTPLLLSKIQKITIMLTLSHIRSVCTFKCLVNLCSLLFVVTARFPSNVPYQLCPIFPISAWLRK